VENRPTPLIKGAKKQAKVKALEWEVDQLVYKLYGLMEEEIKIVEKGVTPIMWLKPSTCFKLIISLLKRTGII
jgi:hypothetical protein